LTATLALVAVGTPAIAAPKPPALPEPSPRPADTRVEPPVVAAEKRQEVLGDKWQSSGDRLWTTTGDGTGFHVLVADAKTGYQWRTAATLVNPAADADMWIGNACVTGSGSKAVVAYAPRTFADDEVLSSRGAFTAVVDLDTGAVTNLSVRTTLAYYNPGCGLGEEVALTQAADLDLGKTGLLTVDTTTGKVSDRTEVAGQFTSAVPFQDGFAVAGGTGVLKIRRDGGKERIARTNGVPFKLTPDAEGGVVYMADEGNGNVNVQRSTGLRGRVSLVARGPISKLGLTANTRGDVFITGDAKLEALPSVVRKLDVPAGTTASTTGEMGLTAVQPSKGSVRPQPQVWNLHARSLKTGKDVTFGVNPADVLTPREVEPDHTCAIPRNDPSVQVLQPKPRQVEWAADMVVRGNLNLHRPSGWYGNPGGYYPELMFPPRQMANSNGQAMPVQVLLGVTGQESNLWQASRHTLPGETGNPLIGSYYGQKLYDVDEDNDWDIDFAGADCGYGITQLTDGMRLAGREGGHPAALPVNQQRAIATDYAANLAAGMQKLQDKWNQMQAAGMRVNDNDIINLENWFFALWAYNSGFYPQSGAGQHNGAWGLGWANNPANPRYDPERGSFGEKPHDYAHPQDWPYPEKVLGFAGNPPSTWQDENTEVPMFLYGLWPGGPEDADTLGSAAYNKRNVKPDRHKFCTAANNCVPHDKYTPTDPAVDDDPAADTGPCAHKNAVGQYDLKCWWNQSVAWKPNCTGCGFEYMRFSFATHPNEEAAGNSFPPTCPTAAQLLPEHGNSPRSIVVDHSAPTRRPGCQQLEIQGNGGLSFTYDKPAAWVDLHQLGTGFGGHMWQSYTKSATKSSGEASAELKAVTTGTWFLHQKLRTKATVKVFIPAHGSGKTTKAVYKVKTAQGVQQATINQSLYSNQWATLGDFHFNGIPEVSLSTLTGEAGKKVAFDALAFIPQTQNWQPDDRVTRFVNSTTGKCITPAETFTNPSPIVQTPCLGNMSDNWLIRYWGFSETPNPTGGAPMPTWHYHLVHEATGLCLATHQAETGGTRQVQAQSCGDPAVNPDQICDGPAANQDTSWKSVFVNMTHPAGALTNDCTNLMVMPEGGSHADEAPMGLTYTDQDGTNWNW
jgi:hypothetical protein